MAFSQRLPTPIKFLRHNERGQAVVETVIVLPLLLLILFSIVTLGYWMNAQQIVTTAAREGASVGALTNNNNQIEAAVLSVTDGLNTNSNLVSILIDPFDAGVRAVGTPLTVRVEYKPPIAFYSLPDVFQKVVSQSVSRMEYAP